ncbi:MAG: hypothetical protein P8X58_14000, partial [Syntrophobacterales bacterium]
TESKAKIHLLQAIEEAKKPTPDKNSLLDHLKYAKDCLSGIVAVSGIVEAVITAYKWVESFL